jgi:1-acyl-sn-glycerol-3-phosphate acyltransferase
MLDLPRLKRLTLTSHPRIHDVMGYLLEATYLRPPGTRVLAEGFQNVPRTPVIFAMNHTDRYNYFPFQVYIWKAARRYTATWVKGKYYESSFVATFMEMTNQLPTVSRGYLITKDFIATVGRPPSDEEYATLRARVDAVAFGHELPASGVSLPTMLFERARDMLGRRFEPANESYEDALNALFGAMMRRFTELNAEALRLGLDVIVFPQGTRSKRLSRGHIGLAQLALKLKATVVPVGCNGSDHVYPGSSPFASGGTITYRFGQPIPYEAMSPYHVPADFEPFTPDAEVRHRERFQGYVDEVMERVNDLLDPEYRFTSDRASQGVKGSARFV